jgi:hypothetical protein
MLPMVVFLMAEHPATTIRFVEPGVRAPDVILVPERTVATVLIVLYAMAPISMGNGIGEKSCAITIGIYASRCARYSSTYSMISERKTIHFPWSVIPLRVRVWYSLSPRCSATTEETCSIRGRVTFDGWKG